MKDENKKYAQVAYDIVTHAAKKIGSRLPGSDNEKKYADYMGDKLREIGIEPKQEEFAVSPRSSIGGIPYAGYAGIILSVLSYFALKIETLWFGMAFFGIAVVVWLVFSVFLYKTWFDMFFRQEISQNTYGELLPPDGKYDYTIILSGHTDTSWTWRHSEHAYKYKHKPALGMIATYGKVGFGALCVFFMIGVSIAMAVIYGGCYFGAQFAYNAFYSESFAHLNTAMLFMPAITALGSCFVIMWADPHGRNASRGAMDNATGCALSYAVTKYFAENPDKMPKNCRIVDFNCGSEEAGLRGSKAYAKAHEKELKEIPTCVVALDTFRDLETMAVYHRDLSGTLQHHDGTKVLVHDACANCGFDVKYESIYIGGSDAASFTQRGIPATGFAAMDPAPPRYYHTRLDTPENLRPEAIKAGIEIMIEACCMFDKDGIDGLTNR